MKKILVAALLLSLLLTGCGKEKTEEQLKNSVYGDTFIADVVGAPEHYTFDAVSESGKSKVIVDAKIIVPEVYGVDVLKVEPVVFTDYEVIEFVKDHTGNFAWYNSLTKGNYDGGGLIATPLENTLLGIDSYALSLENTEEYNNGGNYYSVAVQFWKNAKTGEIASEPSIEYMNSRSASAIGNILPLNENSKANDCTISLEEAIAFADKEAEKLGEDFVLAQYGQTDAKYSAAGDDSPEYYALKYVRKINDIQVNADFDRGVGDDSSYVSGNECIWISVNDDGVCYLRYRNPIKTGDAVEENVKLMAFNDISDIFEKVSMLKIKPIELYEDMLKNDMVIREVRFGYMAVKQSESIGGYRYIPVWDFYGAYSPIYEGPKDVVEMFERHYEQLSYPVITINAIDGTVIDRDMGY